MINNNKINIAILGASGYTGAELIRFLLNHPNANICTLTADSQAGQDITNIYPHLIGAKNTTGNDVKLPPLVKIDEVDFDDIELVFCCLPHGTTQEIIASLPKHVRIIDLSADFRLQDTTQYAKWYGHEHLAPELQKTAIYGLSEHNREKIKSARLIANPGCYPTSALLPLIPLLKQNTICNENIIIDAKSGISGAGRAAKRALNFCETSEGLSPYAVGNHRHMAEMEQELSLITNENIRINFTPHLIPMRRGMITTIYAKLTPNKTIDNAKKELATYYEQEPFVQILDADRIPSTHNVRGNNNCHINIFNGRNDEDIIIISAIDNLVKGASGQAVQNMNIMFNIPETTALNNGAIFP